MLRVHPDLSDLMETMVRMEQQAPPDHKGPQVRLDPQEQQGMMGLPDLLAHPEVQDPPEVQVQMAQMETMVRQDQLAHKVRPDRQEHKA